MFFILHETNPETLCMTHVYIRQEAKFIKSYYFSIISIKVQNFKNEQVYAKNTTSTNACNTRMLVLAIVDILYSNLVIN